ncbi:MAG: alpha/beta fold hydrolase [Vicinamibacterales bacterium]
MPSRSTMFTAPVERERIKRWRERFLERIPSPVEPHVVTTSFGDTSALVAGPADAPPLVVLHGALASAAHVLSELGPLLAHRRVYALDVIGQSAASADTRLPLDDASYGQWTAQACAGLGLSRFDLYGVSWGGFVALKAATVAAARIRRLVLAVPAGIVNGMGWAAFRRVGWPILLYRLRPSSARLQAAVRYQFTTPEPMWTAFFGDALRSYRLDVRLPPLFTPADLESVRMPVLAFGAGRDLSFPGGPLLDRVRELLPQAETELLADSMHCPPFTDDFRAGMARRILQFLDAPDAAG